MVNIVRDGAAWLVFVSYLVFNVFSVPNVYLEYF